MTTRDSTRSELTLVRVVPAPWLHRVGLAVHPQTCPPGRSFRVSLGVIQPQLRQEPGAPAVQGLGRPSGRWRDEHFRWTAADWLGAEMGTRKAGGSNPSVGFSSFSSFLLPFLLLPFLPFLPSFFLLLLRSLPFLPFFLLSSSFSSFFGFGLCLGFVWLCLGLGFVLVAVVVCGFGLCLCLFWLCLCFVLVVFVF